MGKHAPDPRSDQYSLAVVGYQMLTGRVPFEGDNVREVMVQAAARGAAPRFPGWCADIPSAMSATIHQALRKEPKLRFASMNAFARSLRGEMVAAAEGGAVRRESRFNIPTRRRPWLAAAGWSVFSAAPRLAAYRAGLFPAVPVAAAGPPPIARAGSARRPLPATPARRPRRGTSAYPGGRGGQHPGRAAPDRAPVATCESAYQAGDWTAAFALCSADSSQRRGAAEPRPAVLRRAWGRAQRPARRAAPDLRGGQHRRRSRSWRWPAATRPGGGTPVSEEKAARQVSHRRLSRRQGSLRHRGAPLRRREKDSRRIPRRRYAGTRRAAEELGDARLDDRAGRAAYADGRGHQEG